MADMDVAVEGSKNPQYLFRCQRLKHERHVRGNNYKHNAHPFFVLPRGRKEGGRETTRNIPCGQEVEIPRDRKMLCVTRTTKLVCEKGSALLL